MKTIIGAVLAMFILPGVVSLAAASAASTASAAHGIARPLVYDCAGWQHGQLKVREIEITCDSSVVVTAKGWKYWTAVAARSIGGKLWVNTCRPDCAAGHYRTYAGTVEFYRPRSHDGVRYFTRLRLRYHHGRLRSYVYRWATYPGGSLPVWVGGP
jgi:hypothetical protein